MMDFSVTYEQNYARVYAYLLKRCRIPAVAEDLTADTFLYVWQGGDHEKAATIPAYLFGIARYRYWGWQARAKHQRYTYLHPDDWDRALAVDGGLDAVVDSCDTAMSAALLRAALTTLTPKQQLAIGLRFGLEIPETQAARLMGMHYKVFMQLTYRAVDRLRQVMFGCDEQPDVHRRNQPPCSCGRPHYCRGMCRTCYARWKRERLRQRTDAAREAHYGN